MGLSWPPPQAAPSDCRRVDGARPASPASPGPSHGPSPSPSPARCSPRLSPPALPLPTSTFTNLTLQEAQGDPCFPSPCGTGADCRSTGNRAVCSCPPGHEGDPYTGCTADPCSPSPCGANARCERTGERLLSDRTAWHDCLNT
jgi:hypothetical protein